MTTPNNIADNIARIRERMAQAARRAGRSADAVELMAVSKTVPAAAIRDAYRAGQRLFGENRVQEFAAKRESLGEIPQAEFHLIGHLQANKSGKAAALFFAVDSVDSLRLAERLNAAAESLGKILPVLIEINIGGEDRKAGVRPDAADALLKDMNALKSLRVSGLMTIPPFTEDLQAARPYFRRLRELRDTLAKRVPGAGVTGLTTISMGMSHDFEVAIEEGSTCVRIGTAIFGERPPP